MIYGSRFKQINEAVFAEECPNCGSKNAMKVVILQEYIHFLWIPAAPFEKKIISECLNCNKVIEESKMPASLKQFSRQLKTRSRTPVWTFLGVTLILALIILGIVNSQINAKRSAKFILAPKMGDVYEIKTKENSYTLYKIRNVVHDTVFFSRNQYVTNLQSGLEELKEKGESAYSPDTLFSTKKILKKMFEDGEIVKIARE